VVPDGLSRLGESHTREKLEVYGVGITGGEGTSRQEAGEGYATWLEGWQEWLKQDWYARVIYYKLMGSLDGIPGANSAMGTSRNVRRVLRRSAQDFLLVLATIAIAKNQLLYCDRNGQLFSFVKSQDIHDILYRLHDCHGYFAAGLILKLTISRYYRPTRVRDIPIYCRTSMFVSLLDPSSPQLATSPFFSYSRSIC